MNKQRITYIYPSDLSSLDVDENGNYLVPEGFEIYKVVDDTQDRIEDLEKQLEDMTEPTNEELIEIGKMFNDYYTTLEELNLLKNRL